MKRKSLNTQAAHFWNVFAPSNSKLRCSEKSTLSSSDLGNQKREKRSKRISNNSMWRSAVNHWTIDPNHIRHLEEKNSHSFQFVCLYPLQPSPRSSLQPWKKGHRNIFILDLREETLHILPPRTKKLNFLLETKTKNSRASNSLFSSNFNHKCDRYTFFSRSNTTTTTMSLIWKENTQFYFLPTRKKAKVRKIII